MQCVYIHMLTADVCRPTSARPIEHISLRPVLFIIIYLFSFVLNILISLILFVNIFKFYYYLFLVFKNYILNRTQFLMINMWAIYKNQP